MATRTNNKSGSKTLGTGTFILINISIALIIIAILLVALKLWLNKYTEHGIEVEVPQITGLTVEEAQILLQGETLECVRDPEIFLPDILYLHSRLYLRQLIYNNEEWLLFLHSLLYVLQLIHAVVHREES